MSVYLYFLLSALKLVVLYSAVYWLNMNVLFRVHWAFQSTEKTVLVMLQNKLVMMVNKIDRPNTTHTVRAICTLAVYFSVFRPFSHFSLVYEGH